jgi:AcrR family transcriptional regulator
MPPRTLSKATAKQPVARRWSSTETVRTEFLDAARVVFAKRGFTDASVTEVVERAGASVGSLYHHFGSKRDLVRIFQVGDTPPGFGELQRRGGRAWIDANFKVLGAEHDSVHRVLVWLVTSFLGEARREIAKARSARAAASLVDSMIDVLKRMRPLLEDSVSNPAIAPE